MGASSLYGRGQGVAGGQPRPLLGWNEGAGQGGLCQGLQELTNFRVKFVLRHMAGYWKGLWEGTDILDLDLAQNIIDFTSEEANEFNLYFV